MPTSLLPHLTLELVRGRRSGAYQACESPQCGHSTVVLTGAANT